MHNGVVVTCQPRCSVAASALHIEALQFHARLNLLDHNVKQLQALMRERNKFPDGGGTEHKLFPFFFPFFLSLSLF